MQWGIEEETIGRARGFEKDGWEQIVSRLLLTDAEIVMIGGTDSDSSDQPIINYMVRRSVSLTSLSIQRS